MKKIYSKYFIKIKVDEKDFVLFLDKNTKETLTIVHLENANEIDFYLENEFLNDFIFNSEKFYFLDDLVYKIRNVLYSEKEKIFQEAKQLNFVLSLADFIFGEDKKEVVIFYVKQGKKRIYNEITNIYSDYEKTVLKNFILKEFEK